MPERLTPTPRDRASQMSAGAFALLALAVTAIALRPAHPAVDIPVQRINLNTAPAAQLQLLPRIGPALAGAIIADRNANGPYETLDDLDRVPRIGPRTLLKIAPDATLTPPQP